MTTDNNEHFQATLAMHTGSFFVARPSIGSWVSYGLGTVNRNLPSFVVIAPHLPYAGTQVFANDFLPAYHQGTRVMPGKEPVPNVKRQGGTADLQEMELGLADALNKEHLKRHGDDTDLAARIRTFETAFQMQFEAPEAFDLSKETDETLDLYGLKRGDTESFGWQCLIARRLAERGVRFIELIDSGSSNNWDSHGDMAEHEPLAKKIDKPIAGLLHGPEAARDARRHARRVDDGVRPHAGPGRGEGPRAPPGVLLVVAGRRRRQGRARLRGDRRHRRDRGREEGPRPRLPRDDPAPARASTTRG